jgi:hypothetical protein
VNVQGCASPLRGVGVYYTANPGFSGTDKFDFDRKADEFMDAGVAGVRHVTATVGSATGSATGAATTPPASAPAPDQPATNLTHDNGAWSLTVSPAGGRTSACDKSYTANLTVNNGFAQSPYGPVFIARSGGVSGTLTLSDGRGNTSQVVLNGRVAGTSGKGQLSGGCNGTFALSR